MIWLLFGEQSNRVMSRSTKYGARISAPDDLFWRAALVTSGNLQWRAARRSVTAEMAARYPNTWRYHLNIWPPQWTMTSLKRPRSVSRASRRPVNGKKKLIDQETWGFTVQQSRNPTNDYSLGPFTCRHFFKKFFIDSTSTLCDSTIVLDWSAIQSFVKFDSISESINYGNAQHSNATICKSNGNAGHLARRRH